MVTVQMREGRETFARVLIYCMIGKGQNYVEIVRIELTLTVMSYDCEACVFFLSSLLDFIRQNSVR